MTNRVARAAFTDKFEQISLYVDILANRGIEWGLLGPREADRLWDRHILNSVALADLVSTGATVADVGSGAGLPGIPLAVLRPDLEVALIEPLLRRFDFLVRAVEELGLGDRVTVHRDRAEDHSGRYDVVTSRALAPLPRLVRWCRPLVTPGGAIVALKGASAGAEIAKMQDELQRKGLAAEVLTVRAHAEAETTAAVRVSDRAT
ncbi:MAG: 16S rRNA (guanine(527)-N(7))-methyltransferase RsmG [Propionibacteriaceae bacterium]